MTKRLTRSEFYNLIWSRPITKIAADFGLSDVAIHKLCRKHSIPKPVQGHWAKLAHGKPVQIIPLPRQSGAGDIVIVHEGSGRAESVAMSDARTHAKQQLEVGAEAPEPAKNQFLEKTIEALTKAKPDRAGLILLQGEKLVRVHVRPESRERTELVLRELYRHAASAGIAFESHETGLAWTTDGETVSFEIVELVDKVEHVATDAELKAVAKWEAEQEARFERYGYRSMKRPGFSGGSEL